MNATSARDPQNAVWPERRSCHAAWRWGAALLSGLLLAAPCLEPRLFVVAWVGFVPLLAAIDKQPLKRSYLLGVVAGFAFWASVAYWIVDFVARLKGYQPPWSYLLALLFWLYGAQLFGLIAVLFQWLRRRGPLSDSLLFPVVVVAVFGAFPMLFYLRLGEGQSGFLLALQAADIAGAHGVDFMMALVGAALHAVMRGGYRLPGERRSLLVGVAVLVAWFGYGAYALWYWDREVDGWQVKRIGLVQPNHPVSIEVPAPEQGYSRTYPPEMELTEELARRGAELVIWPEVRYQGYFDHVVVRRAFERRIAEGGAPVLFHDVERAQRAGPGAYHNSSLLIGADGVPIGVYRKIKRVAFGEYLPIMGEVPVLRSLVERYLGDFLREIAPGEGHATFVAAGMRIVPKICYESAFPQFIAGAIAADGAGKVLVVLSQDGWFGETRQPFQHFRSSSLRAVENRVPLVHVINNGPSGVVLPSGRVGTLSPAFERGAFLAELPYSAEHGGSFYSRHPYAFLSGVYSVFGLALLVGALRGRRSRAAPAEHLGSATEAD